MERAKPQTGIAGIVVGTLVGAVGNVVTRVLDKVTVSVGFVV